MRYKEFTEASDLGAYDARKRKAIAPFVESIMRDCQPFLREIGDPSSHIMWRGINGPEEPRKIMARLKDRRPKDTPLEIHEAINKYFTQKFGHPFRNGVFCTGNIDLTGYYGMPYGIFPIGEFEFIWDPNIKDFFVDILDPSQYPEVYVEAYKELFPPESNEQLDWVENEMPMSKIMKKVPVEYVLENHTNFINKDLNAAIISGNEIMLWCKSYYAIPRTDLDWLWAEWT